MFPFDATPEWLRFFVYANPFSYAVDAVRVVLTDSFYMDPLVDFLVLFLFAFATLIGGRRAFRTER